MISSNERKLCLCGWLQENDSAAYSNPLRLQKFLFVYEAMCKATEEEYDFEGLRGYQQGPIFSSVWEDSIRRRDEFRAKATETFHASEETVNADLAQQAAFVVASMSDAELTEMSHTFHIWSAKKDKIRAGEFPVDLEDADFNDTDREIIVALQELYPLTLVSSSVIFPLDDLRFVFTKADFEKLTEEHIDALAKAARNPDLTNPIYVYYKENGKLLLD